VYAYKYKNDKSLKTLGVIHSRHGIFHSSQVCMQSKAGDFRTVRIEISYRLHDTTPMHLQWHASCVTIVMHRALLLVWHLPRNTYFSSSTESGVFDSPCCSTPGSIEGALMGVVGVTMMSTAGHTLRGGRHGGGESEREREGEKERKGERR
jgi:hypothetical protein